MLFLVEDNESIRETVIAYLSLAGHEVVSFPGVCGVYEALQYRLPELLILDVMLPDGNGFSLAQKIHRDYPAIPFLFLTARVSESDRITGLELGADDYIVKPFSPRELSLRVAAILRRAQQVESSPFLEPDELFSLASHTLLIDHSGHRVVLDGEPLQLTLSEWGILMALIRNGQAVTTREHLLGEVFDYLHDGSDRTVNTHISNLRSKLGLADWIETIRGVGYRFRGVHA